MNQATLFQIAESLGRVLYKAPEVFKDSLQKLLHSDVVCFYGFCFDTGRCGNRSFFFSSRGRAINMAEKMRYHGLQFRNSFSRAHLVFILYPINHRTSLTTTLAVK